MRVPGAHVLTYNFDPDEWRNRELSILEARFRAGKLTQAEMNEAREKLDERVREMWDRLDGSYDLPG